MKKTLKVGSIVLALAVSGVALYVALFWERSCNCPDITWNMARVKSQIQGLTGKDLLIDDRISTVEMANSSLLRKGEATDSRFEELEKRVKQAQEKADKAINAMNKAVKKRCSNGVCW